MHRYGEITVFKIAAVSHLGFLKFKCSNAVAVKRLICINIPNFVKIGQTIAETSHFFVVFKMAAAAIVDFQEIEILAVDPLYDPSCVRRPNLIYIRQQLQRYDDLTVF